MNNRLETIQRGLKRRYKLEACFKWLGKSAVVAVSLFLFFLIFQILSSGSPAFFSSFVTLSLSQASDSGEEKRPSMATIRSALGAQFPDVVEKQRKRKLFSLLSQGAYSQTEAWLKKDPQRLHQPIPFLLSADADLYFKQNFPKKKIIQGSGMILLQEKKSSMSPETPFLKTLDVFPLHPSGFAFLGEQVASVIKAQGTVFLFLNDGVVRLTTLTPEYLSGEVLVPLSSLAPVSSSSSAGWHLATFDLNEQNRKLTDQQLAWLEVLKQRGLIETNFNPLFLFGNDSRNPELAGIFGALVGSFLMMLITAALCLPTGIAAALYLEEFAPKNRWTELIEVNIQNLAAVPSIIFGLLGLSVFLNVFGVPRSSSLVGGIVLALLVLPTIIVTTRSALKAVPSSMRQAALAIGASHQQAVFHHVLPLAMPGIMTGAIIGMAHALGETAPLLMIGMVAFIVDVPHGILDAASALPVQIFLWSDLPEPAFQSKTSAAILVLLVFLFIMNAGALFLRKRFEKRW